MQAMRRALEAVHGSSGHVLLVEGEPGVGKTRLLAELASLARERGLPVLSAACHERSSRPYRPWGELLRAYTGAFGVAAARKRAGVGWPIAARLADLEDLPARRAGLRSAERRLLLHDSVVRLLASSGDPLVAILDDVHWADDSSLALLEHFAPHLAGSRLLLVAAYREGLAPEHPLPGFLSELTRHGVAEHLLVRPLDAAATAELIRELAGDAVTPGVAEAVHRETGGNPFFVTELVRHLLERRQGDEALPLEEGEIPSGVRETIARRLMELSPGTRRLLEMASAFSGPFQLDVLYRLLEADEAIMLDAIDEAVRAHMLAPAGDGTEAYVFGHAIVRHALYERLSPSRRARLHRRIARALELAYAGREAAIAEELALQYASSRGLPGAAHGARHALAAAAQARARQTFDAAARFLRLALELDADRAPDSRAQILLELAEAEAASGKVMAAHDALEQALREAGRAGGLTAATVDAVVAAVWAIRDAGGVHERLEAPVARALELVGERRDLGWARMKLSVFPSQPIAAGPVNAGRWCDFDPEAVRIAREQGDELDYARTFEAFEMLTREETEELVQTARVLRDPAARLRLLSVAMRMFQLQHADPAASEAVAFELLELSRAEGSVLWPAFAYSYLADAAAARGDWAIAAERERLAYELIERLGGASGLRQSVHLFRRPEDPDWLSAAEVHRDRSFDHDIPGRNGLWHAAVAASLYARAGRPDEAQRFTGYVLQGLEQLPPRHYQIEALVGHATEAAWVLGDADLARKLLPVMLAVHEAGVVGGLLAPKELTLARLLSLAGDADGALAWFERARRALEDRGQRPLRAITDHDEALARIRARLGAARPLLVAARRRFDELGMTGWIDRADRALESLRPSGRDGLTEREVDIVKLVAAGRSNKEIAAELDLSPRTVERHLVNAYAKLGVRNRAEATAYVFRAEL